MRLDDCTDHTWLSHLSSSFLHLDMAMASADDMWQLQQSSREVLFRAPEVMRTKLQLGLQPEGWGTALSMHGVLKLKTVRLSLSLQVNRLTTCRIGPPSTRGLLL